MVDNRKHSRNHAAREGSTLKSSRQWVGVLALVAATRLAGAEDVLMGRVPPQSILGISQEWQKNRDDYAPAEGDIARIAGLQVKATLDVYFGSWCSDSRREVPHLLKILDEAAASRLKVKFYGLDRTKKKPRRLAERGAIQRVPTFVLRVKGTEVGRIVETPKTTLEHDLALLIDSAASPTP